MYNVRLTHGEDCNFVGPKMLLVPVHCPIMRRYTVYLPTQMCDLCDRMHSTVMYACIYANVTATLDLMKG